MSEDRKYNGWTNYETWAVKLWIDNEESSHEYWRDSARSVLEDPAYETFAATRMCTADQLRRMALANELKEHHEVNMPDSLTGVYSDLLNAALSEVNWFEIAQAMLDDEKENQ